MVVAHPQLYSLSNIPDWIGIWKGWLLLRSGEKWSTLIKTKGQNERWKSSHTNSES